MKGKKPKIFHLNEKNNEIDKLLEIQSLLNDGKFQKVIDEAKAARAQYPNNFFFYTIASIALSALGKKDEEKSMLEEAVRKFPDEPEVHYNIGKTFEQLEQFEGAELAFRKSLELTPADQKEARSDCLNDLGVIYWKLQRKEEALEHWKLALIENPNNVNAQNNYREFTNAYGEPVAVSPLMDDVFHFQNIQTEKYFKSIGKDVFSDNDDANKLIAQIMEAWNNEVAPNSDKLDSLSPAQKTKWFKSIEIDFNKEPEFNLSLTAQDSLPSIYDDDEMFSIYDCVSEDEILVLPFTLPLLHALGIKQKRVDDLFGKVVEPTDYEADMIGWAVDVCISVGNGVLKKKNKAKNFKLALDIAKEELEDDEAKKAVDKIKRLFQEMIKLK